MLYNLVSKDKIISFIGCLLQMYFFHSFGVTEGLVLTIMAIDRYVAICNPLRYAIIITPQLCTQLCTGSFILGFFMLLPEIVWISTLPFCGPNHIHQLFCDLEPVLLLVCADTSMILAEDVIHAISILTCVSIITLSYLRIITVILRFPSGESRQKAFSTCSAHITIFLLFFGSVVLMYLRFSVTFQPILEKIIALMFAVLAPFFNPIIYSLRNKDMKDAIKKMFCSQKLIFYCKLQDPVHISSGSELLQIIFKELRIPSAAVKKKAFSTCVSHRTVVLIFYGSILFMYVLLKKSYSLDYDRALAVVYSVVTPFLNPFIYSLCNKEIKEALKRQLMRTGML
ncbi:Olfactory receptor 6K3 [Microtus ochrogaster]|uniref:Olfactory receptor 6K3 n=1 Tax=Microtus ochrogaster TaxID=79684 RepID=A0A8J6FX44_MICOH|nr:Olfactory receptor 6K3 [Microtus ochrogaster]